VPYTPKEAAEYWANYEKEHPEYIVTQRTNFAQQYADRVETQAEQASKCELVRSVRFSLSARTLAQNTALSSLSCPLLPFLFSPYNYVPSTIGGERQPPCSVYLSVVHTECYSEERLAAALAARVLTCVLCDIDVLAV
jgi:hypothetical protein